VSPSLSRTAIVTDSAADIPAGVLEAYGIRLVPVLLVIDGESLPDGQGVSRRNFYERLASEAAPPPTTATPPPEAFAGIYRNALDAGASDVLSIHVAGSLSGIAAMAQQAAQAFSGRVRVVDTGQASLGTGFQVIAAAREAASGKPPAEILAAVAEVRRRIRVIAMIDDLEFLRRSGRVDWLRSSLGSLLHLRVLVELADGIVRRLAQVRSRTRAIEALVERATGWGRLADLGVLHTSAETDARGLAARLAGRVAADPLLVDVTPVIGTHVGPRALGLAGVVTDPGAGGSPLR